MADSDLLIEILVRLRDEAGAGIDKLKRQVRELQAEAAGSKATAALSADLEGLGDAARSGAAGHDDLRHSQREVRREAQQTSRVVADTTKAHDKGAAAASAHADAHSDLADGLENVTESSENTEKAFEKLIKRGEELRAAQVKLNEAEREGTISSKELERASRDLASQLGSVSRRLGVGSDDARSFGISADESAEKLARLTAAVRENARVQKEAKAAELRAQREVARAQELADREAARSAARAQQEIARAQQLAEREVARTAARAQQQAEREAVRAATRARQAAEREAARAAAPINRLNEIRNRGDSLVSQVSALDSSRRGNKDTNPNIARDAQRDYAQLSRELSSVARVFPAMSEEARKFGRAADDAAKSAKGIDLAPAENTLQRLSGKISGILPNIKGISAELRGLVLVGIVGLFQVLDTAGISLVGSLVSVASAAVQAGGALGGALVSGLAQAAPAVTVLLAGLERIKSVLQAVKLAQQVQQQSAYNPTQALQTQIQATQGVVTAQQALANAYSQVTVAQEQVKHSQEALTLARITAIRNITDLTIAEKTAAEAATGAKLTLTQAENQLQSAQRNGSQLQLEQAQLAVQVAQTGVQTSGIAVPRAQADAARARSLGVAGNQGVVGSVQALAAARLALVRANEAVPNAKVQLQLAQLVKASPSSSTTSTQGQLNFLLKQFSPVERRLYDAFAGLEKELKKPGSPLQKIGDDIVSPIADAVVRVRKLFGTTSFLKPLENLGSKIKAGLGLDIKGITGARGTTFFEQMAGQAALNVPIIANAGLKIEHIFMEIATAAAPALHQIIKGFDEFVSKIDHGFAANPNGLKDFFTTGEKYLSDFLKLGHSIFDLFMAIGRDAAPQGARTINDLNGAIQNATKWVQSHGTEIRGFFDQFRQGTELLGGVLFAVGKALIQVFDLGALKAFASLLTTFIIPGLRDFAKLIGFVVEALTTFINLFGTPGRVAIEGLVVAFAGLLLIGKIISLFDKLRGSAILLKATFVGLWEATKVFKATGSITAAWEALVGSFKRVRGAAEAAKAATVELGAAQEATAAKAVAAGATEVAAAEAVTVAEAGAAVGAAGVGAGVAAGGAGAAAAGGAAGGFAAKAAGVLKTGAIAGAVLYAANKLTPSETSGGLAQGLPSHQNALSSQILSTTQDVGNAAKNLFSGNFGAAGSDAANALGFGQSSTDKLRTFADKLRAIKGPLEQLDPNKIGDLRKEAQRLAADPSLTQYKDKILAVIAELVKANQPLSKSLASVQTQFTDMASYAGQSLLQIKLAADVNMAQISNVLGTQSAGARAALAQNFALAAQDIETSIQSGVISVKKGLNEINTLMSKALKLVGVDVSPNIVATLSDHGAGLLANATNPQAGHTGQAGSGGARYAEGGYIGRAGQRGRDNRIITAGDGEAMLNAPQQAIANHYMARGGLVGGLGALFSKTRGMKHYASGGLVFPLQSAGPSSTWTQDQGVDMAAPSGSHALEYAMASGKIVATGISGFGPSAPVLKLDLPIGKYGDIYYGHADSNLVGVGQRVRAGQPITHQGIGIVGMSTGDHLEIGFSDDRGTPIPGSAGTMMSILRGLGGSAAGRLSAIGGSAASSSALARIASVVQAIKAPKAKGVGGALGVVSQGVLNIVTKAANNFIGAGGGSAVGAAGNAAVGAISTVGGILNIARQAAAAMGVPWNASIVKTLLSKESGGGQNLPPHNYGGILDPAGPWQVISSTFASNDSPGHANRMNPVDNTLAAFHYIKGRYGTLENLAAQTGLLGGGYKGYATGGTVGNAPWGGRPVPIMAHEGERVSNPNQWGEVARMAGTTPAGLDRHLGYDGSAKQHFAPGGRITAGGRSGSGTSLNVSDISASIAAFLSVAAGPEGTQTLGTIANIFKLVTAGLKKLSAISAKSGRFTDAVVGFIDNITSSIFPSLQASYQALQGRLSSAARQLGFSGPKNGRVISGPDRATSVDAATISNLETQRKSLDSQQQIVQAGMSETQKRIAQAKKIKNPKKRDAVLKQLNLQYSNLQSAIDTLSDQRASAIEAQYQAQQQLVQDEIAKISDASQTTQSGLTTQIGINNTFGNLGANAGLDKQLQASFAKQVQDLQKPLQQARAMGDASAVAQITQQIDQLNASIAQYAAQAITDEISVIDQAAAVRQSGLSSAQSQASSLGNYSNLPALDAALARSAQQQIADLQAPLQHARAIGDTAAVNQITQQIDQLNTSIVQYAVQAVQDAISAIQQAAQTQSSFSSLYTSLAGTATAQNDFAGAGRYNALAEQGNISSDTSQIAAYRAQLAQAQAIGDTGAVASITQSLNSLTADLQQNIQALKDNTYATNNAASSYTQGRTGFQTGINSTLSGAVTTLGTINGGVDTKSLLSLLQNSNSALNSENAKQSAGLNSDFGVNLQGLSGKNLINAISALPISQIESGMSQAQTADFENYLNNLASNTAAIETNTQEIMTLNGTLLKPQTFTTTAFKNFRASIFNGMGGLLPEYSVPHMDTGGVITKTGIVYAHIGERILPADQSGTGGDYHLHVTNPTETADPEHLARRFAFEMKTVR